MNDIEYKDHFEALLNQTLPPEAQARVRSYHHRQRLRKIRRALITAALGGFWCLAAGALVLVWPDKLAGILAGFLVGAAIAVLAGRGAP